MKKILVFLLLSTATFAQNITPQQVIEKYITAIGGRGNIDKIKDITTEIEADAMGQILNIKYIRKAPNMLVLEQSLEGNILSKIIFDGTEAIAEAQGQTVQIPEAQINALKSQASAIGELSYLNEDVKLELLPNEKVKEEDCYVIKIDIADIGVTKDYYSVKSGLKIRTDANTQGMDIITYFNNYKEFEPGVKFPMDMKQEIMGQILESAVTSIQINKGIDNAVFNTKK